MDAKKYRLGNQPKEYELVTNYLGWLPEHKKDWFDFLFPFNSSEIRGRKIIILNPQKTEKIEIILHQQIIKDAFPLSFFGEERAKNWHHFCIVSKADKATEQFIIPLH
jgi:hypothetical protein